MKRFFAIPVAFLILLSGMHFTIAKHYCDGELAATKVSLSGKAASCGMVIDERANTPTGKNISTRCCENVISVYAVEGSYTSSVFQPKVIFQNNPPVFVNPEETFNTNYASLAIHPNVSPPYNYFTNAVSMADICVFRI